MMYRRLCVGLNDLGELIPTSDDVFKHIKNFNKDHYLSLHSYTEEQKKKFYEPKEKINKKTGEIYDSIHGAKNINDVFTNHLVFDFDDEHNLEQARKDTVKLCERLIENGVEEQDLIITFSGNKGFGVEVTTDQSFSPDEIKATTKSLAGDLPSFDTRIWNASRIVRVPFTKHQDSKLYKMPMNFEELQSESVKQILEWAKDECEPCVMGNTILLPEAVLNAKYFKEKVKKKVKARPEDFDIDLSQKPKWLSNWKYALMEGYFPAGARNDAMMILGATCRGQGLNKLITYRILKGAAELQSQRTGQDRYSDEQIWTEIVEQIYESGWKGGTYAEENFPDELADYLDEMGIPRQKGEVEDNPLVPINDVYDTFEDFAENIEKNTIRTGIKALDKLCRITTSMLVGILGSPGAGKTATILNILNNHSDEGEASIFFSFDMGKPLVYQKMAQKFTGFSSEKIFNIFKNKDEKAKAKIRYLIEKNYKNVQMCFRTAATVSDMKRYIQGYEEQTGKKVRMIGVDYLEKLVGPFSDATANSGYNAAKLQELATELELCVLLLLQPQKMAGDPSDPLLTYRRIKGASVIEQDCRVVISVFREGYDPQSFENDYFITYAVLKNTMGELGSVDNFWDGLTGDVTEIDDEGRAELKRLRKAKAEKKVLGEL